MGAPLDRDLGAVLYAPKWVRDASADQSCKPEAHRDFANSSALGKLDDLLHSSRILWVISQA